MCNTPHSGGRAVVGTTRGERDSLSRNVGVTTCTKADGDFAGLGVEAKLKAQEPALAKCLADANAKDPRTVLASGSFSRTVKDGSASTGMSMSTLNEALSTCVKALLEPVRDAGDVKNGKLDCSFTLTLY